MKVEYVKLNEVRENKANPRFIRDKSFGKLIDSVLIFPRMLELRPIIVDTKMTCLGGNMRFKALTAISKLSIEQIGDQLSQLSEYALKTANERAELIEYWDSWLDNPQAIIMRASEMTETDKKAFIIKDNVSFGEYDMDMIANEWTEVPVEEWGLEVEYLTPDEDIEEEDQEKEKKKKKVTCPECGHEFDPKG